MVDTNNVPPLAKHLGSNDKKTRDTAVKGLASFLSASGHDLPPAEMAKLWKGIFYCFWMSDKPLVQQALATELAELLLIISSSEGAFAFLQGFWQATVREWGGIDRLRMDKYYMLVRRFVNASFRLLQRMQWSAPACEQHNAILSHQSGPLTPDDPRTPASLAYHISEIYLSELDKVLVEPSEDAFPAPTLLLVEPFLAILASSSSKNKYKHVHDGVLEPLFEILDVEKDASEASDDEEDTRPRKRVKSDPEAKLSHLRIHSALEPHSKSPANAAVLRKALSKRVFAVASADGTRDANRRRLYGFLKTVGADGEDDDDEDV